MDRPVLLRDLLTYSDINEVLEAVCVYSTKMRGVMIVGIDKNDTSLLWHAGLTDPEMVYLADVVKENVFKPRNYIEADADDE